MFIQKILIVGIGLYLLIAGCYTGLGYIATLYSGPQDNIRGSGGPPP